MDLPSEQMETNSREDTHQSPSMALVSTVIHAAKQSWKGSSAPNYNAEVAYSKFTGQFWILKKLTYFFQQLLSQMMNENNVSMIFLFRKHQGPKKLFLRGKMFLMNTRNLPLK